MEIKKYSKQTILNVGIVERNFPAFAPGDTIRVAQKIQEGNKERIQQFEGDVIAMHQKGISSTFTVRRIGSDSVAIERIYPYYSPIIDSIVIVRRGDVRRAKLYYVRDRVGRAARFKERIVKKNVK